MARDCHRIVFLFVASLAAALSPLPAAAAKTDVIVLKNGDRVTGEVKQLARGYLTYKTDDMGTLDVEWDNVAQITAKTSFEVDDLQGGIYIGTLQPGPDEGQLMVVGLVGSQTILMADVVRIQRLGDSFWGGVDGSIDVGLNYTSSNELSTFDFFAEILFKRPSYQVNASLSSTLTQQPEVEDTRRNDLTLNYVHLFPGRRLAFAVGELEQNRALGIDMRASVAGGPGWILAQTPQSELMFGIGLSLNREVPVDRPQSNNAELVIPLRYDKFAYDFPNIDIRVGLATFVGLSDWGRVRAELDLRLKRELLRDFSVSLIGWESYDNRPPTPDGPNHDYGLTFTLGWTY